MNVNQRAVRLMVRLEQEGRYTDAAIVFEILEQAGFTVRELMALEKLAKEELTNES